MTGLRHYNQVLKAIYCSDNNNNNDNNHTMNVESNSF